tara:strand:- start:355 stop:849 length:495 start_codon:yes stop_codon:yes gene_type:complete
MPTLYFNLEDWSLILKINLILSLIFSCIALFFVSLVLYLRILKNIKESHRKHLEARFIDFVNAFLFDETINKSKALGDFKYSYIKSSYDHKILIKQFLIFDENLKGESSLLIKEIFYGLGLYKFLLEDLQGIDGITKHGQCLRFLNWVLKFPRTMYTLYYSPNG